MLRKLLLLAAGAVFVRRLLRRRADGQPERVVVGYADGSALTLEPGTPERERLVALARKALAR